MEVLPERVYAEDAEDRRRLLPYGLHPAKMNVALTLDLVRRYTLPGDTIIDPFLGIGGTGLALLEGRRVLGIELEAHHAENAVRNLRHLEGIARDLGHVPHWELSLGDSQRVLLGLRRDAATSALTSPAFGEMNAEHAGGNVTQRPNKDGRGFEGGKEFFTYNRNAAALTSPPYQDARSGWNIAEGQENIRYAPPGQPGSGITSPPYADALQDSGDPAKAVERIQRKVSQGKLRHPEGTKTGRRTAWGGGQQRVYQTGYGAGVTSPPYEDTLSRDRSKEPYAAKHPELSREYGRTDPSRSADGYGKTDAQIGNMRLKDGSYQRACQAIYAGLYGAIRDGGVLVVVTGNYVRKDKDGESKVIDLAAITVDLAQKAGWTPVERWTARKKRIGFWRIYWEKRGQPRIDYEDILVFCKGERPGWPFLDLPPTGVADDPEIAPLF